MVSLLLVHNAWRTVTDLGFLFATVVLHSNCGQRFFFLISASLRWGFDSCLCLFWSQTECPWKLQLKAMVSWSPGCFSDSRTLQTATSNSSNKAVMEERRERYQSAASFQTERWQHSQYAEKCCMQHGLKVHECHLLCSESGTMKYLCLCRGSPNGSGIKSHQFPSLVLSHN